MAVFMVDLLVSTGADIRVCQVASSRIVMEGA